MPGKYLANMKFVLRLKVSCILFLRTGVCDSSGLTLPTLPRLVVEALFSFGVREEMIVVLCLHGHEPPALEQLRLPKIMRL